MLIRVPYSVHMPLFFFLPGLSIPLKVPDTWEEWRFSLHKNVLTFAIPYLLWPLMNRCFRFRNADRIADKEREASPTSA